MKTSFVRTLSAVALCFGSLAVLSLVATGQIERTDQCPSIVVKGKCL